MTGSYPDRCFASGLFGAAIDPALPRHVLGAAQTSGPAARDLPSHHGIRYFHGCYCVGDDQLRGITREHKGADHTLAALRSFVASALALPS